MTPIAPHMTYFLREHLPRERRSSDQTCETYAYSYQLLVRFAADRLCTQPSELALEQIDAPLVLAFLDHLEAARGNCPRTRNNRLAAVKAFFRYLEYRLPACLEQARCIRAIAPKKTDDPLLDYLTPNEMQAILDAPSTTKASGLRDRAMLLLAFAAGLRVSELVGLRVDQVMVGRQPTVHIMGKGRRERALPLWKETVDVLRDWLAVRETSRHPECFLNARGEPITRSGFEYILSKYVKTATGTVPSIAKKRISPHVLRRTCAMHMLQATRDVRKVALWLGHASLQSTEIYLHADPAEKLEALGALVPPSLQRGQFRAPDKLLAMLQKQEKPASYAQ